MGNDQETLQGQDFTASPSVDPAVFDPYDPRSMLQQAVGPGDGDANNPLLAPLVVNPVQPQFQKIPGIPLTAPIPIGPMPPPGLQRNPPYLRSPPAPASPPPPPTQINDDPGMLSFFPPFDTDFGQGTIEPIGEFGWLPDGLPGVPPPDQQHAPDPNTK